jgi:DUF1680 family protein
MFSTPHDDTDQVFGLLTGYPCCTCNMHQGWPKLTQNLWYATKDNGLAAMIFAPSKVNAKVADGVEVEISEETFYPFDETVKFTVNFPDRKVKGAWFPIKFRIPQWCDSPIVKVNDSPVDQTMKPGCMVELRRNWKKGDCITVEIPMKIKQTRWYDKSVAVERGPLLYALKMDEKWERKEMEEELLHKINNSGIGPGGLGGRTTAFAVNINTYPTHIAGLPVAVNICCHVNRHAVRTL